MAASWDYVKRLAQRSEQIGYDLTLVAELFLNDIKGIERRRSRRGPPPRRWPRSPAAGADGRRAPDVPPAGDARQAGREDRPHQRRAAVAERRVLVVGGRGAQYGVQFDEHDDRYARTREWLTCSTARGARTASRTTGRTTASRRPCWRRSRCTPARAPRCTPAARARRRKTLIADKCDAYVMHGDPVEVHRRAAWPTCAPRRERSACRRSQFGMAAYAIVRDTERGGAAGAERASRREAPARPASPTIGDWTPTRSWSGRWRCRTTRCRTAACARASSARPSRWPTRVRAYQAVGVDLLLLQCSPQLEEMERFAEQVIRPYREARASAVAGAGAGFPAGLAEGIRGW